MSRMIKDRWDDMLLAVSTAKLADVFASAMLLFSVASIGLVLLCFLLYFWPTRILVMIIVMVWLLTFWLHRHATKKYPRKVTQR